MKFVFKAAAIAAMLAAAFMQTASASPMLYSATLSGANEFPATPSLGKGTAIVILDPFANTMEVDITFSGLSGNTTASHIHCCLQFPFQTGFNAGVATTTPTFTGFPLGVTSGSYSHIFDMTQASSYNPAFVTASGGTVLAAELALFAGIESGETYLNIHSSAFPTGEIRGFLRAPEPVTISLFGAGLAGIAAIRRRRKRAN